MKTRLGRGRDKRTVLLPLLLTAIIYLFSSSGRAVTDYDEGYYSQAALQMVERGDWVTPYVNGMRFLEKPPLMYWLTAISYQIFGVNEFALRLPTALGVIALVWVVTLIAHRATNGRVAIIAGLCTAFSAGTYLFTRESLHDIWLVLFITIAMYAFLDWYLDPLRSRRRALLFYAAVAAAVMCKSLIGIVLPVGIVVAFFILRRERVKWRTLHVLPGSMLFLALTVPWHWLAAMRNQDFLWDFFVNEQFLRFLSMHDPPVVWSLPLLTFWALIPVWFFPWTAFLPAAIKASRKPLDSREQILVKLLIAWIGIILGFFSISGRLEHYIFPILPALSLVVGSTLSRENYNKSIMWAFRGLAIFGVVIMLAAVVAGIWLVTAEGGFQDSKGIPGSRIHATDFSILKDMPESIQRNLIKPAVITIIILVIGFSAALWFETCQQRMRAIMSLVAVMMVMCGMIHWSFVICEDMISSKKFALAIARQARPDDRLLVVGDFESANSLNFYQPLRVELFDGVAYALIPGMKYQDASKMVLTGEEFKEVWNSANQAFALLPTARQSELKLKGVEILEVLDRVLIRNH